MNPALQLPGPAAAPQDEETDIRSYIDTILDHRILVLAIALSVTLGGIGYAFLAKPVYETNLMVHVEESSNKDTKNILGEMNSLFDYKTAATAEMELLRSRLVVSRAIDNLRLYVTVRPKYFPVVGGWLAARSKEISTPGLFGYGGYAWGAERMEVSSFNVPDALLNRRFVLTAEGGGQYRLQDEDADIDLRGKIGAPLTAQTDYGAVELKVERIDAKPGAQFYMTRHSRLATIEDIQRRLSVSEQGKQSGVIVATLQGRDPAVISSVLNEIGKEYVRQNAERKTEEAGKALANLNKQLPELKQQLEQSEAQLNQFRNTHGTIDLGEEAKLSLQQAAAAKLKRIDLEQKRTELLGRFTTAHPAVMAVDEQIRAISAEIRRVNDHIKTLPLLEQDILRLSRDVKVNTELYTALLNTAQQLRVITAGKGSNVRLVDAAMTPEKPVTPDRPKIIAIAFLLGLFLGIVAAFVRKALRGGIDDAAELEKMLGLPVYATIPHSKTQQDMFDEIASNAKRLPLLARVSSTDIAIESLRTFRAALQHQMGHAKNNIVLIAGPTPGMGKTFVSVNLAAIQAASGKRVILIDADFRNGHLHRYFELGRQGGLSDCIVGSRRLDQIIHRGVMENMDFISTGSLPPNPSELLLHPNLEAILKALSSGYDMVLIDAAPILPVADTLIIGAHAGSIYVMTRAGVTSPGEISEAVKRLHQAGLAPKGIVFNDIQVRPGRYGYGYRYGKYRHTQYLLHDHQLIEAAPN
ncbi:MAG TPA: polysaccharide biosynthesis tyrosine autokinase [Paucimonas sp.]|nr:polysaccharide biosynthesis tyrosine autokinase [Paucimonas sp.]